MKVKLDAARLDATFFALSDATRRAILLQLAGGEATVNELKAQFSISQPAISRHLKVLEHAGLIVRGRNAQRRPAAIDPGSMHEITAWMDRYRETWETAYRRLDNELAQHMKGT